MAKQLAISTQLKNATAKLAELEKKLGEAVKSKEHYYREAGDVRAELEQVHAILDAIPAAPARNFTPEGAYSPTERKTPARLAAFFAIRA
jgi:hypothetical protein